MTTNRYDRQILLKEIGGAGQEKLARARVLLVGAGGLAAGAVGWLMAAGIGELAIMDDDTIEPSNLNRQIFFREGDIGKPKAATLAARAAPLNPDCRLRALGERLTPANALARLADCDIIADGSDNFATRFLLNDAAFFAKRPLVSAALAPMQGQLTTLKPYERDANDTPLPCYRSLVPDIAAPAADAPCERLAVVGALCGVMGALQAMEIIKEIAGFGESLAGRLLLYDAPSGASRIVAMAWDPANPLNGRTPRFTDLSHHV